jgi:DNA-binding CsgD family transcriptional regulator
MADDRLERTRQELCRVLHRGLDVRAFFAEARAAIGRSVHLDGCCWMAFDPATMLPTAHIGQESIPPEQVPRLAHNEYREKDVNKFAQLARGARHAGILRDATGGEPERSARYREILRPNGFAAELRASFVEGSACWGGMAMYRAPDSGEYAREDRELVERLCGLMAEGMRRAILASAAPSEEGTDAPGMILLDARDRVEAMTPPAEHWLNQLPVFGDTASGNLPSIVYPLVDRARRIASGAEAGSGGVARVRIRTLTGRWLVLHGSLLAGDEGRAAVIIEPARPPEIAPLIVGAYGLSERECDVTQLVMQGLSTNDIATTLHFSPYTVQDHLKAIFEKVGVRSRRELVAEVFFRHYAPRMGHGENLAADGWFAERAQMTA